MTDFNPYLRVEDDSPDRCQATMPKGQCHLVKYPGSNYCINHGGNSARDAAKAESHRGYRLGKYQARMQEFANGDEVKSLRQEIGILRVMVEERMSACQDTHDLMMHSTVLADLIMKVEKLVVSCNRLEVNLGVMLDKTQALQFGSEIVEIVAKYVEDEDVLSSIADEIIQSIDRLAKPKAG